jgi:branched-chain amino acid transport system permease protein
MAVEAPERVAASSVPPAREHRGRLPVAARVATLVILGLAPLAMSNVWADTFSLALIYALMGLSVVVLTGFVGQLSLMPATFVGVGAFCSAALVTRLDTPFWFALPLAALAAVPVSLAIGAIALRLPGLYLAIMTLVFADVIEQGLFKQTWFTGPGGGTEAPRPHLSALSFEGDKAYYLLVLGLTAVVLAGVWNISRSRTGRACFAVRDNPSAAQAWGINVAKYKLLAFALSGFIAGFAGGLSGHWSGTVSAGGQRSAFGLENSLIILFFTIVGGVRSIWGPVIGGVLWVTFVNRLLAGSPNGTNVALSIFGAVSLATMLWRPSGLISLGEDIRRLARRSRNG